ncbi:MAG: hypothetical protein R2736_13450 [Solirubrobacterales bacterium]
MTDSDDVAAFAARPRRLPHDAVEEARPDPPPADPLAPPASLAGHVLERAGAPRAHQSASASPRRYR